MKTTLLLLFIIISNISSAQKIINYELPAEGNIKLAEGIEIPKINPGYTIWLPENGRVQGLILFTRSRRDTLNSDVLIEYALSHQLAILYATTDNRLEFLFDIKKIIELEGYLHEVISTYHIPKENLLFCGMSLEGTRALKMAGFAQGADSKHKLIPKAIAICDAPLDFVRFHKELKKAAAINFHPVAAGEGMWVSEYVEANLGGTPADTLSAYISYSPYCYSADGGENLGYFQKIAIRAYTEPDVNWWMETRRKDYYAMNAIDLAGLINDLNILGNEKAQLFTTHDKGYFPDGSRHPHSWSIVDEKELIDWFLALIKSK